MRVCIFTRVFLKIIILPHNVRIHSQYVWLHETEEDNINDFDNPNHCVCIYNKVIPSLIKSMENEEYRRYLFKSKRIE